MINNIVRKPTKSQSAWGTQKTLFKNIKKHWQLYLLLLPTIIYFTIFRYIPMYGVQIAFKNYIATKGFAGSDWVGFKHFIRFITTPDFGIIMKNTIVISVYQLVVTFPLPIIIALMLNQVKNDRFKKTVQNIIIAPHFISLVVLIGMVTIFLNPTSGILNKFIEFFGGDPIFFLGTPEYFKSIYVFSGVWQSTGWGTVIYLAALSSISPTLYEAAEVDGANKWRKVWHIDVPGLLPVIITQLILSAGRLLSIGYDKILLLQNPLNRTLSEVISTYEYKQGILGAQFSYSAAIGLFNAVINCAILLTVNHLAKKYSETSLW